MPNCYFLFVRLEVFRAVVVLATDFVALEVLVDFALQACELAICFGMTFLGARLRVLFVAMFKLR